MAEAANEVTIRTAEENDCEDIYRLIKELADYVKMSDHVNIDADVLRKDGFGKEKFFQCIVAVEKQDNGDTTKQRTVGYALYYYAYSTWDGKTIFIEDIYVTPDHRGKGIGTRFWKHLALAAVEKGCKRMELVVINWNTEAIKFYKSKGAFDLTVDDQLHLFRINQKEMEKIAQS